MSEFEDQLQLARTEFTDADNVESVNLSKGLWKLGFRKLLLYSVVDIDDEKWFKIIHWKEKDLKDLTRLEIVNLLSTTINRLIAIRWTPDNLWISVKRKSHA